MPVIVRAPYCDGPEKKPYHRVEIREDGAVRMLDHHDRTTLEAFTAFGAEKPQCLYLLKLLSVPEPGPLVDILHENDQAEVLARIGLEWATHVAYLVPYYSGFPEADLWLEAAERVMAGDEPVDALAHARDAFDELRERLRVDARKDQYSPMTTAARDATHAIDGAVHLVDEVMQGARLDFGGMLKALGRSAYHAMGEDAVAQGGSGLDEDTAKHEEVAWQRLAAIKAADGLDLKTRIMEW
jgi:hypothetical protein